MRLLDRTLITLLLSALLVTGLSSVVQYYWVKTKIENRVDKKLLREKKLIKEQLKDINPKEGFSYNTERASVRFLIKNNVMFNDSLFYDNTVDEDGEKTNYRILQTRVNIAGQYFKVEIRKEVEETKRKSKVIYRAISKIDKKIGKSLITALD